MPVYIGLPKPKDFPAHCLKSSVLKPITFGIFPDLCDPIFWIVAFGKLEKSAVQVATVPKIAVAEHR